MEKLQFSIVINAPKEKVWNTMLDDATYRQWTSVFNPTGSYFEGSWETGSDMRFLGPEKDGKVSGMLSRIKESRPFDFLSIEHLGEIVDGEEKPWSSEEKQGMAVYENYTFIDKDGGTEVVVDLDSKQEYKEMFEGMWPKALEKLKALAEQ